MIYGETGKFPLKVKVKMARLMEGEGQKWSEMLLRTMLNTEGLEYKWISGITNILHYTGHSYLVQQLGNIRLHLKSIEQTLVDQSLQELNTDAMKCKSYLNLKSSGMPHYLKKTRRKTHTKHP